MPVCPGPDIVKSPREIWRALSAPLAGDPDDERREYITRVVLLVMGSISFVLS